MAETHSGENRRNIDQGHDIVQSIVAQLCNQFKLFDVSLFETFVCDVMYAWFIHSCVMQHMLGNRHKVYIENWGLLPCSCSALASPPSPG